MDESVSNQEHMRQLEEALRLAEFQIENLNSVVMRWDPDGIVTYLNPYGLELFGFKKEEIIGVSLTETIVPRTESTGRDLAWMLKDILEHPQNYEKNENENICRDGSREWMLWRNRPILDSDGNLREILTVGVEISDRKQLEQELQEANERMGKELNYARDIQMSMLPLMFPAFPNRRELDVYAVLKPAREVGGDFYDFGFIDDDNMYFVIGDVSGKGAPGALLMAVSKTLIKYEASEAFDPAKIIQRVNEELSKENQYSMFVTVFLGVLNVRTGEVFYCNAGHNPPYLLRKDGSTSLLDQLHGPIVGVMPGMTWKFDVIRLNPGDKIFLYTDGVTEAMNIDDVLFTDERLAKLLQSEGELGIKELIKAVVTDVHEHQGQAEQADDITVLALEYVGADEDLKTKRLSLLIKNDKSEMARVEEEFELFCERAGIPAVAQQQVSIVLDELLSNIVSYAYEDELDHQISVGIERSENRMEIRIKDDGIAFNPFLTKAPDITLSMEERQVGGLGIHLVRNMMDEYLYQRMKDLNVVTLVKMLE